MNSSQVGWSLQQQQQKKRIKCFIEFNSSWPRKSFNPNAAHQHQVWIEERTLRSRNKSPKEIDRLAQQKTIPGNKLQIKIPGVSDPSHGGGSQKACEERAESGGKHVPSLGRTPNRQHKSLSVRIKMFYFHVSVIWRWSFMLIVWWSKYVMVLLWQISSPRFPVVVKMGHAHSGMGKVRLAQFLIVATVLFRLLEYIFFYVFAS